MSAREEVLGVLHQFSGRRPAEVDDLAARLGAEIRTEIEAELREEHERDLVRARERSFDFGVRAALRLLRQSGRIGAEEEDALTVRLAAAEKVVDRDRLRADLDAFVVAMPDEPAVAVEDLVAIIDRWVP